MPSLPEGLQGLFHYALADGRLLGSEDPGLHPRARELVTTMVQHYGVRVLMTLTAEPTDYGLPGLCQYHRPLSPRRIPSADDVRPLVALVLRHVQRGEPVWCHCRHGLDRTGSVLGCSLVALGVPPARAIADVTAAFPPARRTPRLLALWEPYAALIRAFPRSAGRPPG